MSRSHQLAAGLLLALPVLAGCGTEPQDAAAGAATGTTQEADADATRVVAGAYGEIEIPVEPQRIVADLMTVDYLTALGYDTSRIVGVFGAEWYAAAEDHYLDDALDWDAVADPGFAFEADLEEIASLDPDLVLVPFDQIDRAPGREKIARIAPLLAVPTSERTEEGRAGGTASYQDWRGTLTAYGELLDREEEAAAYLAETDALLDELRAEHGEGIADTEVVQAKSAPDFAAINPITSDRAAIGAATLGELGFAQPARVSGIEPDEYGTIEISDENTDLLDADLLFLEVREGTRRHEESPLWPTLDVVQDGDVVTVGNHWEFGGAVGARAIVEDIDAALDERSGTEEQG